MLSDETGTLTKSQYGKPGAHNNITTAITLDSSVRRKFSATIWKVRNGFNSRKEDRNN